MNKTQNNNDVINIEEIFGIDLRSLALFRIAVALFIIIDLIQRVPDITVFYSDEGVFPRAFAFYNAVAHFKAPSIYYITGSTVGQLIIFGIAGLIAISLLVGYKTRLCTFLSWLLLISLHMRNEFLLAGGDFVMRLLLFWSIFLPLGACWSIDRALDLSNQKNPNRILSVSTTALLLQICFVYWFSVCWKIFKSPEWLDGTALYYALHVDHYARLPAYNLLNLPIENIKFLTHLVVYFEIFAPILIFSPIKTTMLRIIMIIGLFLLQVFFNVFLRIGSFPYSNIIGLILFIPSTLWEKILFKLKTSERLGLKIYFDDTSELLKKLILIFKTLFLLPETKLEPIKTNENLINQIGLEHSIIVSDYKGGLHTNLNACYTLCNYSPLLKPVLSLIKFVGLIDIAKLIYNFILKKKERELVVSSLLSYRSISIKNPKFVEILAAFFIVYIFFWNLGQFNESFSIPTKYKWIGINLVIDQAWAMFAPLSKGGYWFVIPGKLKNGKVVDLHRGGSEVTFEKPKEPGSLFKNRFWSAYLIYLYAHTRNQSHYPYYSKYLCDMWNKKHSGSETLEDFEIYLMIEITPKIGEKPTINKGVVWKYICE